MGETILNVLLGATKGKRRKTAIPYVSVPRRFILRLDRCLLLVEMTDQGTLAIRGLPEHKRKSTEGILEGAFD